MPIKESDIPCRILITWCGNKGEKRFSLTRKIASTIGVASYSRSNWGPERQIEGDKKIDWRTTKALNELLALPGITSVGVAMYTIIITKSQAFEWRDYGDEILQILTRMLSDQSEIKDRTTGNTETTE